MNRDQKAAVIEEIAAQIQQSEAVFAIDYRGLSVEQAAELRGRLRGSEATLRIVKNTLTERAADRAGAEGLKGLLDGPTALTFARGDVAAAAKAISDYARATGLLPFKGGVMDGETLAPEQVAAIARLPTREVLHAQLVNVVASPLTGLVTSLSNLIGGLARQLAQIADKKESGELPAGEPPAGATAEAAATPAETRPEAATPAETRPEAAQAAEPAGETASDTEQEKE